MRERGKAGEDLEGRDGKKDEKMIRGGEGRRERGSVREIRSSKQRDKDRRNKDRILEKKENYREEEGRGNCKGTKSRKGKG